MMESISSFGPQAEAAAIASAPYLTTDLVIIGGGPAGLSAGIYAERNGIKSVIIEKSHLGGQVLDTTYVENYPGLKKVSGKSLAEIMVSHALDYVTIHQGESVLQILAGPAFRVVTDKHVFEAKAVLLATGARRRTLGLPNENRFVGKGISYSPTRDGHTYQAEKCLIVGGGDSAVTEAIYLREIGVEVTLLHRSDTLDAQKVLCDRLQAAGVTVLFNTEVRELLGNDQLQQVVLYNNKTGATELCDTRCVFVSIGYTPAVDLARQLGLELTSGDYIQNDSCRTSIKGLYVAGDVTGGYKQIVTASSQGAEAAITIFHDMKNGML